MSKKDLKVLSTSNLLPETVLDFKDLSTPSPQNSVHRLKKPTHSSLRPESKIKIYYQ